MAGFFLHFGAIKKIRDLHPRLFERGRATDAGIFARSGLKDFGWRGQIYEVAQDGGLGTVEEVEQTRLYDFMNYLSYLKAQSKHRELYDDHQRMRAKAAGK